MNEPPDDLPIARYTDLARFTSMLLHSGLFFAAPDRLGDPHEGKLGAKDIAGAVPVAKTRYPDEDDHRAFLLWERDDWQPRLRSIAVSCWYAGNVESHAMWRLYGNSIAIETTVGALKRVVAPVELSVRTVDYRDYDERPATNLDPMTVLSFKRPGYQDEREIRAFLSLTPDQVSAMDWLRTIRNVGDRFIWLARTGPISVRNSGVVVRIPSLADLITGVVVSPEAPIWLHDAVMAVLDKFGFPLTILRGSELDADPYSVWPPVANDGGEAPSN